MMNAMKIKSICLTGIICVFLSYALMESAIYGAELEEGVAITEAEAKKLLNVSYKGLSADIQKIFDSKSASCAACIKEKIENDDAPTTIHIPVHLLFDYKDSSVFIDASVDINSIKQEKFNPKFYNIKKLAMTHLNICVSSYLLAIYKEVIKISPELAGQLMERKTVITIHKNKEEYWRETALCDARNRCFETPYAVVKVKGYDEAVLETKIGRKFGFWNLGPLKDLGGNATVNFLALKFWEVEAGNH